MKLEEKYSEVYTNVKSGTKYSIAQSSKLYKLLSDTLYSDKIAAVIRELGSNAVDSHIAAGNYNNFHIHLPSVLEPVFTVRDYGTGLSQEEMENLYTTYGASNKNHSNDFIGGMGIGSKSPFCYTKSFNTTSYYNGKQYSYVNTIDEDGVPDLKFLCCFDTDEPNGLEVSVPVKDYDIREFAQKSKAIYKHFLVKPDIEVDKVEYYYKNRVGFHSGGSYAIIGGIAYSINFLYNGVDLFFDIGELDIDISRERLQYTEKTKRAITSKEKLVEADIEDVVQEYQSLPSFLCCYNKIFNEFLYRFFPSMDVEYKGRKLNSISRAFSSKWYTLRTRIKGMDKTREAVRSDLEYDIYLMDKQNNVLKRTEGMDVLLVKPKKVDGKYNLEETKKHLIEELGCLESDIKLLSSLPFEKTTKKKEHKKFIKMWVGEWEYVDEEDTESKVYFVSSGDYIRRDFNSIYVYELDKYEEFFGTQFYYVTESNEKKLKGWTKGEDFIKNHPKFEQLKLERFCYQHRRLPNGTKDQELNKWAYFAEENAKAHEVISILVDMKVDKHPILDLKRKYNNFQFTMREVVNLIYDLGNK